MATSKMYKGNLNVDKTNSLVDIANHDGSTKGLSLAGTLVTATAAEINAVCDASAKIVNATASTLTVTAATHNGKIITLNRAAGIAVTLPAASGSGNIYEFIIGTTVTSNSTTIKVANSSDLMIGRSMIVSDDPATCKGFIPAGTDDTITFNGTTTGGYIGDHVIIKDVATNTFHAEVFGKATGTEATPFSATV
jgi:hypothetical protein